LLIVQGPVYQRFCPAGKNRMMGKKVLHNRGQ